MICEKCKHEIGAEELKCPYCGADNQFAIRHEKNMRRYKGEYAATEKEVSKFSQAVEGLGKKAAVLVILIIGIIVFNIFSSMNYADPDEDAKARRDGEKNAAAYAVEADGLLERGEYVDFVSFMYAHELMNFSPEEFSHLQSVKYVAKEYYECITLMESMILRSDDPEYFDSLDTDIRNFCMYADGFYEVFNAQMESEKDEKNRGYMLDMESELHAALRVYFGMDEAQVQEFFGMSRSQKAVRVQEVLRHE